MTSEERFERIERNHEQLQLAMLDLAHGQRALQQSVGALIQAVAAHVEASEEDRKRAEEDRKRAEEDRKRAEEDRKRLEAGILAGQQSFEELRAILRAFIDSLRRAAETGRPDGWRYPRSARHRRG